jgi:hypothetical protein
MHSPRQRSVLFLRRTTQLRLQLRLDQGADKFGSGFHTATVAMAAYGGNALTSGKRGYSSPY